MKWTKKTVNAQFKKEGRSLRLLAEPEGSNARVLTHCTDHNVTWEPYLGNLLNKKQGCKECGKRVISKKLKGAHTVSQDEFLKRLHAKNPDGRIVFYSAFHDKAKVRCLKCGYARTDIARNLVQAGCQNCKVLHLDKLKKDRTLAWRQTLAERKQQRADAYLKHLIEKVELSEHVTRAGTPYLFARTNRWKCRVTCNYCSASFTALVDNLYAGTKCRKCSMRWAKTKQVKLGSKTISVQGYEPQALEYIQKHVGIKPKDIETEKVPRIKYHWMGRNRWYYPDFLVKDRIIVEVKSDMTLGLGGWWGSGKPPFDKNKAKHQGVLAAGYKFKLLVVNSAGKVAVLPEKWLTMSKEEVKAFIKRRYDKQD